MLTNALSSALIIFVKNPIPGKVKTRLGNDIGMQEAADVYLKLMQHTKSVCDQLSVDKYVYYGDFINHDDSWSDSPYKKRLQVQGDLGMRMHHAIAECLEEHDHAVLIGTDCPEINERMLKEAFRALTDTELVIGPAVDGGYYLIGMNEPQLSLFDEMTWSVDTVYAETIKRITRLAISYTVLPELHDVDKVEDWEKMKGKV